MIARPHEASDGPISIQTVADQAGVSIATVSRVLNGNENKVSAATRDRVLGVVQSLGYRPSRVGSALRSGRSRLVAVMIPDPANAYNDAIATSIEARFRERGKLMVFCNTQESPRIQDELIREMRAQLVSGIVMLGAVESDELSASLAADEPIVFVNRKVSSAKAGIFVGIDNRTAGTSIAELFAAAHHERIWMIHGSVASSAAADRVQGFLEGMDRAALRDGLRIFGLDLNRMEPAYALACRELTRERCPQAIFCLTDEIAYGVYRRCRELGLSVPGDVHLFGFDGNPLNAYLAPWLSTIRVPYEDFGTAVAVILDRIWSGDRSDRPDVIFPFRSIIASG